MKSLTYNNVNSNFSFENVCLELNKFWIKENLLNKTKIWLTITVHNKQNKSFTLINNLPFNVTDYTDVIIVLKQVFNTKNLSNRKDKINNIVFKYYLETKPDWKEFSLNIILLILYYIFLILSSFIMFYVTSILFDVLFCTEVIDNSSLEIANNSIMSLDIIKENTSIKNNKCVFSIFSDLFDKSCSYQYYPNNFIDSNINITCRDNNASSVNSIISKQFCVLDKTVQEFTKYFNNNELLKQDLNSIAIEYSYYRDYCINK